MLSTLFRITPLSFRVVTQKNGGFGYRFFSKIFNFKATYPELYAHVHPDSLALFERDFVDSSTIVKWVCHKGPDHIWESDIGSRIHSFKRRSDFVCLYCCGRRISVTNCLSSRFPAIAEEWDYEKNGDATPDSVTCYSIRDVWWKCSKDPNHRFRMSPNDRTFYHNGCPYCSEKLIKPEESLVVQRPDLAQQWDTERNGGLKPESISPLYKGKVWWICPNNSNHHWKTSVSYRVKHNTQCPHCRRIMNEGGSIAEKDPWISKEWDYAKNGVLTPNDVSIISSRQVWWKCEHGVEWKQSIIDRHQNFINGYHRCDKCKEKLALLKSQETK